MEHRCIYSFLAISKDTLSNPIHFNVVPSFPFECDIFPAHLVFIFVAFKIIWYKANFTPPQRSLSVKTCFS